MRTIDADALKATHGMGNECGKCEKEYVSCKYDRNNSLMDFCGMIDDAPTIEAEPKWIPCSERLPKECEEVLITWMNTNPASYYANIKGIPFTGCGLYCRGRWFWYSATCKDYLQEYGYSIADEVADAIKITAWMPLPEPYKEGQAHGDACEKSTADIVTVKIPIVAMGDGEGDRLLLCCDTSKSSCETEHNNTGFSVQHREDAD